MNRRLLSLTLVGMFGLVLTSDTAQAARYRRSTLSERPTTVTFSDFGVGIASTPLTVNPVASGLSSFTAASLSTWFTLAERHSLQTYFSIPSTSPFNFGVGTNYKFTLTGDQALGFHIGGGFGLGSTRNPNLASNPKDPKNVFFFGFTALGGMHFKVPNLENLMVNFDAGPTFTVVDGNANFTLAGLGGFLGASLHYLF